MLTENDLLWLESDKSYQNLKLNEDKSLARGNIRFKAAFDKSLSKDQFTLIAPNDQSEHSGLILNGEYEVTIKESVNPRRLPELLIHDDTIQFDHKRHFNTDKSACVCGIIEEVTMAMQGIEFKTYIEEIVIPFLYGQRYYDEHEVWPWNEYAHNTTGALESYFHVGSSEFVPDILKKLSIMPEWERVQRILLGKKNPKGHIPCFCKKGDHIRRCHPDAFQGICNLYEDIRKIKK